MRSLELVQDRGWGIPKHEPRGWGMPARSLQDRQRETASTQPCNLSENQIELIEEYEGFHLDFIVPAEEPTANQVSNLHFYLRGSAVSLSQEQVQAYIDEARAYWHELDWKGV